MSQALPTRVESAGPRYRVSGANPQAHVFEVRLHIESPQALQRVSLPVWIPGSYLIREFARHLHGLSASQGNRPCAVTRVDKCTWELACEPGATVELRYRIYAFDLSLRAAHLDAERAFFNGTSVCLRVHGQEDLAHRLELPATGFPKGTKLATGLTPERIDSRGFGIYSAQSYDELVDAPVEVGEFWEASFLARGVPHRLVVTGAGPGLDSARLVADVQAICETQIRFWHGRGAPPHKDYTFLLRVLDSGYGGLEHRNSTALMAARRDLPQLGDERRGEGYITLLGLVSHEYFHTWNVKRLRPRSLLKLDYSREQDTRLLWFFEGFTSYYDDLFVRRAKLIDDATYLRLLSKTWNQVLQTPGRNVQSVEQAAADAWIKYYRPDEATPNVTVSYYTKGALVALGLDLRLRRRGASLDDVMRRLWKRCAKKGLERADLLEALAHCGGEDFDDPLAQWVDGTAEIPLGDALHRQGVDVHADTAPLAQALGVRVGEGAPATIKTVLAGSPAETAGLCPHDELVAVESGGQTWQLRRLDDLLSYAGALLNPSRSSAALDKKQPTSICVWVARDRRILRLNLPLPLPRSSVNRLAVRDSVLVREWLDPR